MKNKHSKFKIILLVIIASFFQNSFSQCTTSFLSPSTGTSSVIDGYSEGIFIGQGFTANCNGYLESVELIAANAETCSAGTLFIYTGEGTTVFNGTATYSQSFPEITTTADGDSIKINLTGDMPVVQGNKYIFAFLLNNIDHYSAGQDQYTGGVYYTRGSPSIPASGYEIDTQDFLFSVSITDNALGLNDFIERKNIKLSPNPSNDYITISNLQNTEKFKILNMLGQKILIGTVSNNNKIDITNLDKGLYFFKFEDGHTIKFIRE